MCEFAAQQAQTASSRAAPYGQLRKQDAYDMLRRAARVLGVASATWQAVLALWLLDAALDAEAATSDSTRRTCAWAVEVLVGRDVTFPDPKQAVFVLQRLLHCEANALAAAYLDHARATLSTLNLAHSPEFVVRHAGCGACGCDHRRRQPHTPLPDCLPSPTGRHSCGALGGW